MIKKTIILFLILINISFAKNLDDIKDLYSNGKYAKACTMSGGLYLVYKDDEVFLNLFADSCLRADMLNRLMLPIIKLYRTKAARENAAYFSTILYEKKMLYHALCDGVNISYMNLPKTNYILSKIFDKFIRGKYNFKNGLYWFSDDKNIDTKYKLSIEKKNKIEKMYLRTYRNNKIIKTRIYW